MKGSPYNGNFRLGLIGQPDIVELNKTLTYELTNPSLFTNAAYGSTWEINSVSLTNEYGMPVNPLLYSFSDPGPGTNGILTFASDTSVLDSNIFIRINYSDLGLTIVTPQLPGLYTLPQHQNLILG